MKVSFPIMGNSYVAFKQLVEQIGHEPVVPPLPSSRTMTLGTTYSPEFACIPFKILMGTYLEAIEKGAELIISSGGHGPCRAGYYGEVHQRIINELGYKTKVIIFDSVNMAFKDFFKKLHYILRTGKTSWWQFIKVYRTVWDKLLALDEIELLAHQVRPYEVEKGKTSEVYRRCLAIMDQARTRTQIKEAKEACFRLLQNISQDKSRKPLKIGIVGEIYVQIEPFANLDIQATLGEMGVFTKRGIHLSEWWMETTHQSHNEEKAVAAARPYLNQMIGGHGILSVGETILYARRGFDGVIQLAPFSCIPEIVAKSILTQVSRDYGIPVLTIFLDEQTGREGLRTRLEAFVDLLQQRRQKRLGGAVS
ncbi:MAG: CoA protein activase [Peptococcaceae bacterium]|nr:CoA protein activase [Peptococcaceae bacterium]MDH7526381.1 CoA protein activase [Peptococcaceae bacterium]